MNNPDHISESLQTIFWVKILEFFDADPDPGFGIFMNLDPGLKKFGSGINIPDPHYCIPGTKMHADPQPCLGSVQANLPKKKYFFKIPVKCLVITTLHIQSNIKCLDI